jgi:hypothetical protein
LINLFDNLLSPLLYSSADSGGPRLADAVLQDLSQDRLHQQAAVFVLRFLAL